MKSKLRLREGLENFVQHTGVTRQEIVTDPYFSILARASVEIGILNSKLQSLLFVSEIGPDSDNETHRLFSEISTISANVSFGFVERWTTSLDEARTIVGNALLESLNTEMLNLYKLQLEGELENGCEELAVLSLAVFDWLKEGHETTTIFNKPMTLSYAKWLVIDHTLYQMRGADFREEASEIEKWLVGDVPKPSTPIIYACNYLLDQFISEDASAKKYDQVEELEAIRALKRRAAGEAGSNK